MLSGRIGGWLSAGVTMVLLGAVLLACAGAVRGFIGTPIETVRIEGDLSDQEKSAIRAAIRGALRSPQEVLGVIQALGWARDVSVRRVWPFTYDVSVTKETLAARWGGGRFLTTSGRVVAAPESDQRQLPNLTGVLSDGPRTMQIYRALSEQLAGSDFAIIELSENELGEWRVRLDNGIELRLGATDLIDRLERFVLVYDKALTHDEREVAHVDARYASGVAVRWVEATATLELAANLGGPNGD